MFLSKYGEARVIEIPVIKRAVVDFAVGADWTPAAGDVKITKDGGVTANVTNLPTALAMGNTALWSFSLTATEMQAARVVVTVADAATKAVEDQAFVIETYGHASAQHTFDLDTASSAQTGDAFARLGAPAGASVSADILAAQTDLDNIQTRLPAALVAGRMDSDVAVVQAGAIGAGDIAAAALNEIADAILDRIMSTGTDSGADNTTARTVRQALRALRNNSAIVAGTLTVYKEDDTTASWTSAITTAAGNPISQSNPT